MLYKLKVFKMFDTLRCLICSKSSKSTIFQETALFSGTLRFNLDPLDKYTDDHIWNCIQNSVMSDYIHKMPNGLNTIIESGGIGLSNGEKQVITCIRGLLSKG